MYNWGSLVRWRGAVAFTKDPVLFIWDAINLLTKANTGLEAQDSTRKIIEAERILLELMLDLWRSSKAPIGANQLAMLIAHWIECILNEPACAGKSRR